jgi:hypothetical protein
MFVREFNHKTLILQVPRRNTSKVHLKYPTNNMDRIKIVKGWKNFCYDNDIKLNDRVRFEFSEYGINICEVTKLNN